MAERSTASDNAASVEAGTVTTAYILEPITAFAYAREPEPSYLGKVVKIDQY